MARKSSARRKERAAKSRNSRKPQSFRGGRSVATNRKKSSKRLARTSARSARPKSRQAAGSRVATKSKTAAKPKPTMKVVTGRAATSSAAKSGKRVIAPPANKGRTGTAGATGRGGQGALDFETGPSVRPYSESPPSAAPRRRNSAKPGSPDWPGESLTVGMLAPDFSLPSTSGRKISLSEFRGKRVILYFYPKDDTPGCTMEACAFRDHLPRIQTKDAVVLGVSLDDELSHQRFAQKYNLPFPLLSDVDAAVSRQYGTYKEKNLYGRSYWGIERTTFVIDREGRVENVFRRVKVEGHAEEVMATLAI